MYIIELLTPAGIWALTVNNQDKKDGARVAVFKESEIARNYIKKNLETIEKIALGWRIAEFNEFSELK
jgi:hypothetical protein